jgi:hypothetical protein
MTLSFFPSIQDQSSAVTTSLRSWPGRARQADQNKPISSTFHEIYSEVYDFEKWMNRILSSFHDCETSRGRREPTRESLPERACPRASP